MASLSKSSPVDRAISSRNDDFFTAADNSLLVVMLLQLKEQKMRGERNKNRDVCRRTYLSTCVQTLGRCCGTEHVEWIAPEPKGIESPLLDVSGFAGVPAHAILVEL